MRVLDELVIKHVDTITGADIAAHVTPLALPRLKRLVLRLQEYAGLEKWRCPPTIVALCIDELSPVFAEFLRKSPMPSLQRLRLCSAWKSPEDIEEEDRGLAADADAAASVENPLSYLAAGIKEHGVVPPLVELNLDEQHNLRFVSVPELREQLSLFKNTLQELHVGDALTLDQIARAVATVEWRARLASINLGRVSPSLPHHVEEALRKKANEVWFYNVQQDVD